MKKLLSLCIAFLTLTRLAEAHPATPWPDYLAGADKVCLARVTSVEGDKVTFEVTDVLRGKTGPVLVLTSVNIKFTPKSEWPLVSCPTGFKDSVGFVMAGDCSWIPAPIIRNGGNVFVVTSFSLGLSGEVNQDVLPDGTKGLTLDHVKQLLRQSEKKPEP
jgi:hypothetical protein